VMKMHPRRSLPRFEQSLYWKLFTENGLSNPIERGSEEYRRLGIERVVLFADCFTTYNEPRIGLAAVRVLEHLGYDVELLPESGQSRCCGRSMISVGMLEEASRAADASLEMLAKALSDPDVKAIVVCEPSCLSAIKDDWMQLKLRTPLSVRKEVAAKSMLVEEFVERALAAKPEKARVVDEHASGEILLHAHCHQKALWGAGSSSRMLERLAPGRVKVLDTGCCGMAGSFGYSEHRFDLSNRIGELTLFPAVRAASPGATLAATGTSCRHQIHDGVGAKSMHPIEIAAKLLGLDDKNPR